MATIETFNNMSDSEIQLLDIRNVLSGNARAGTPVPPEEDILRYLCETMNATELDQNRRLDELDALDSGGEGDAASINSQEPLETPPLQSQEEIDAMQAAAAELKSLGTEAIQAAAAEVADQLVRMTRAGACDQHIHQLGRRRLRSRRRRSWS